MPDEPLVETESLTRAYRFGGRELTVLGPLTCRVRAGEHIALVGPSGSGKSTLLNLMADLDRPSAGRIGWPGLGPAGSLRPAKLACVFQMPSLIVPLTIVENVELPLKLAGLSGDTKRMAMAALRRLGLAGLAARLPDELSGGQGQCAAIARALALRPRLVLADEPTSQLDRATAHRVLDILITDCWAAGAALVIATHDPAVTARMPSVWRLDHGILDFDAEERQS